MNVFTLVVLTTDFTNGEADMQVSNYATVEDAKKEFDAQLEKQVDIFDDIDKVFSIDRMYEGGTPESEMTDENCFSARVHNNNGLSVLIEIREMPILSIR